MVVVTGVAVGTVATGGALMATAAGIGAAVGTSGAIAGASAATGAITGAAAGTAAGTAAGAVAGGAVAGGAGAGALGTLTGLVAAGPVGWLVVGATKHAKQTTLDCWKAVIKDTSVEPSDGMLLRNLCSHPNVRSVKCTERPGQHLPGIIIENIWNETFEIEYIFVENLQKLFCHAKAI